MGQQQLLFIVLGVIIVGLAIIMGINLFSANAVEVKRDNLINECVNLAAMAHQYYRKPQALGGGGRTFNNWEIPLPLRETANGRFVITNLGEQEIRILAIGNEVVTGNDSVKVDFTITPNDYDANPRN